jgi:hypothetical protein
MRASAYGCATIPEAGLISSEDSDEFSVCEAVALV